MRAGTWQSAASSSMGRSRAPTPSPGNGETTPGIRPRGSSTCSAPAQARPPACRSWSSPSSRSPASLSHSPARRRRGSCPASRCCSFRGWFPAPTSRAGRCSPASSLSVPEARALALSPSRSWRSAAICIQAPLSRPSCSGSNASRRGPGRAEPSSCGSPRRRRRRCWRTRACSSTPGTCSSICSTSAM